MKNRRRALQTITLGAMKFSGAREFCPAAPDSVVDGWVTGLVLAEVKEIVHIKE